MINNKFTEIVKRYTENKYLTKSQIKDNMGQDYEELMWLQIREYRERYKVMLSLRSSSNNNMIIHITPNIIYREIQLHKDITQLGLKTFMYERLIENRDGNSLDDIKHLFIINEVIKICQGYNFKINTQILIDIVQDKYKANDEEHHFASVLYEYIYSLEKPVNFNSKFLVEQNSKLYRQKHVENVLRSKNIEKIKSSSEPMIIYEKEKNYIGFDSYDLQSKLNELDIFLNEYSNTNTFTKAVIVYYYIKYGRFFQKYNEASAVIAFYAIIASEYPNYAWSMKFGTLLVENFKKLTISFENSEINGCDITYLLHTVLKLLHESLSSSINSFESYIATTKTHGAKKYPKSELSQSVVAKQMMSDNPRINKKQALFYLNHNDPNKYYDIKDFLDYFKTSYETSRYSLDNLVKEGFYEKTKIGKKFFYKITK